MFVKTSCPGRTHYSSAVIFLLPSHPDLSYRNTKKVKGDPELSSLYAAHGTHSWRGVKPLASAGSVRKTFTQLALRLFQEHCVWRLNWFRCLIFMSWTSWAGSWACGPEINTKLRQIFRFVVALKKSSDNEINSTLNKLSLQWESLDIWWFKPKKTPYLKTVTTQWEKKKWCICRMTLQKPTNGFVLVYLHWKNVFLKTN